MNDAIKKDNFVGFKVDKLPILKDGKACKTSKKINEEILIWNMVEKPLDKSLIFHIVPKHGLKKIISFFVHINVAKM